jgi:hypothetical protein
MPSISATNTPAANTSQSPVCPRIVANAFAEKNPRRRRKTLAGKLRRTVFHLFRSSWRRADTSLPMRVLPKLFLEESVLPLSPPPGVPVESSVLLTMFKHLLLSNLQHELKNPYHVVAAKTPRTQKNSTPPRPNKQCRKQTHKNDTSNLVGLNKIFSSFLISSEWN